MGKTLCAVLALLFVACMCIDEAGEKDVIKRGKEIFRSLKGNPKGTIKKEQMRAMLTALFDGMLRRGTICCDRGVDDDKRKR